MRALYTLVLCGLLAVPALAQRGGGGFRGGGGGGFRGGGISRGGFGGASFRGGGFGGSGFRGGFTGSGFRGGFAGSGFRGGFNGFRGFRGFHDFDGFRGFRGFRGIGFGGFGLGFGLGFASPWWGGYWPGFYDYGYPYWDSYYPYDSGYGYGYAAPAYYTTPGYASPGVNIVYAPQSAAPAYVERANPVTREYDQYGQEVRPSAPAASGSPIYLIAFLNDHIIRAASAYWVDGRTLHYVTLQHEERQAPIDSIDRSLTTQLNRERHVQFQLP